MELLQVVGNGGGGVQAHFEGSDEGLTLTSSDNTDFCPTRRPWCTPAWPAFSCAQPGRRDRAAVPATFSHAHGRATRPAPGIVPRAGGDLPDHNAPFFRNPGEPGPAETEVATTMSLSTIGPAVQGESAPAGSRGEDRSQRRRDAHPA